MIRVHGCTGKLKHATREQAVAFDGAEGEFTARGFKKTPLHPYQCTACGCWHLSSIPQESAERAIARAKDRESKNRDLVQRLLKERGLR